MLMSHKLNMFMILLKIKISLQNSVRFAGKLQRECIQSLYIPHLFPLLRLSCLGVGHLSQLMNSC